MAIFQATSRLKPGTRSNTKLAVSGGDSPAGQWVTDPNLPILFTYDYGGPGQKQVVVSKGLLVGVAPQRYYDDALGYNKNALTIATDTIRPFGMAPYNFTQHINDFLDGNQPSVITREYIELPIFDKADDAAAVKWGAAYNETGAGSKLAANDLVTWSRNPENFGKIIKWEEGKHSAADVIGQVGEVEDDQEPFGWLKWAMWDEAARREDQDGPVNKSGYAAPGDAGYPFDPEYTRLGKDGEGGYLSQYTTLNDATGIKGILDGRQKAQTTQSTSITLATAAAEDAPITVKLGHKNIIDQTVVAYVGTSQIPFENLVVDLAAGIVTIKTPTGGLPSGTNITVQYRAEFFGTPAGWDHKGAVGAVRILLKF